VKVFACSGTRGQLRDVHDPFLARHTFEIGFQQLRALDGRLLGTQEPVPQCSEDDTEAGVYKPVFTTTEKHGTMLHNTRKKGDKSDHKNRLR